MMSSSSLNPLALNAVALGQLVRQQRLACGLSATDAAAYLHISPRSLIRLEQGERASTDIMFRVLREFGLAMLVMPKASVGTALAALGHRANWNEEPRSTPPAKKRTPAAELPPENHTPTLFLDFDGTLHAGHALIDAQNQVSLDSGRPLFEFTPLLVSMLAPYPAVAIVLTTSWLQRLSLDEVMAYLPLELARRIIGTTKDIKPRLGDLKSGTDRTAAITSYAYGKGLRNWLAIDDSVHGAYKFGQEPGELLHHFVLLDADRGINDEQAQERIRSWLAGTQGRP
ncbi:HAD domain-containing protein [Ralstonia solanacearum]|uniref:HAD domain-containing protein n=1 Tax=Ralstonia solanacearum TaxID=305 RepID=UPI003CC5D9AF